MAEERLAVIGPEPVGKTPDRRPAIRVAVVGAGYWGPNLIRNFATLPGSELAAVCDVDPMRLGAVARSYPGISTTTRLEELLADPEVQAVAVATPAESHRQVAEQCLRAGKHIYVEKPLASRSEDARAIVLVAEEAGRILMVGHLFLYDAAVQKAIDLAGSGALGAIRYVHGVRTSMGGTARLDTSIVWDALVHDAYVLPALFGRAPRRVLAVGQGYLCAQFEDVAFVTFDFGDGALAHVYASWYALEKARRLVVVGSDGILAYDDLGDPKLMLYARRYERGHERDPQGRPRWHWRDEGGCPVTIDPTEPLRAECEHFLQCVREGRRPRTDGRAGLEAVHVLEACQQSLTSDSMWIEISSNV